ncbi:MAG: hypothetical protein SFU25_11060 [Candidatus Caenarcaniphilales bacterium]|nr:hypothetical protein [Candidatus Caenarcaniphilales bacterium]
MSLLISKLYSNISSARTMASNKHLKKSIVLNSSRTASPGEGKQWLGNTVALFSNLNSNYNPQRKIVGDLHNEIAAIHKQNQGRIPLDKLQRLLSGYDGLIADMTSIIESINSLLSSDPEEVQLTKEELQPFLDAGVETGDYRSEKGKRLDTLVIRTKVLTRQLNSIRTELDSDVTKFSKTAENIRRQMPKQ